MIYWSRYGGIMTVGMLLVGVSLVTLLVGVSWGQGGLPTDVLETASGELRITFVGHGSLFFTFQG